MIRIFNKKLISMLAIILVLCSCFFINTKEVKAVNAIEDYYNCEKSVLTSSATSSNAVFGVASMGVGTAICTTKVSLATAYYVSVKGVDATVDMVTTVRNCINNNVSYAECFKDVVQAEAANVKGAVDDVKKDLTEVKNDISKKDPDVSITDKNATSSGEGCDKIGNMGKYVTGFYNIFRYIVPALIIIFSVIDFLGVVFSGEDDKMEKAKKNFIIRLVVGILILMIPFMLEFILGAAGIIDGTIADAACNFIS